LNGEEASVHDDLPVIPVFPLGVVVLPGEALPLHIFEERYKTMLADCRSGGPGGRMLPFGVSLAHEENLFEVGCTVSLERIVKEYDDGRLDILTVGRRRYRVVRINEDRPYLQSAVEFFDDEPEEPDVALRERAYALAARLTEMLTGEPAVSFSTGPESSFQLAAVAGFDLKARQELLEMRSENARLAVVTARLVALIAHQQESPHPTARGRGNGKLYLVN
jgi:Lon protease-like protein